MKYSTLEPARLKPGAGYRVTQKVVNKTDKMHSDNFPIKSAGAQL